MSHADQQVLVTEEDAVLPTSGGCLYGRDDGQSAATLSKTRRPLCQGLWVSQWCCPGDPEIETQTGAGESPGERQLPLAQVSDGRGHTVTRPRLGRAR